MVLFFQALFTAGLRRPMDIAVDYITGNIYFSDTDDHHIAVCSNNAYYCKALITQIAHLLCSIALHPQKGEIYWTVQGSDAMIGKASMDGTSQVALITTDIRLPNCKFQVIFVRCLFYFKANFRSKIKGIAIDGPNERLYWTDGDLQTVESCKLDGSDRRIIIEKVSANPYGIAIFQDNLFWSDWHSQTIESCDKFTGKNRSTIVTEKDHLIFDISVYHPAMQPTVKNPCFENPCSHLCLLNMNGSYTCECPKQMEKLPDNKNQCRYIEEPKELLIGIKNHLVTFKHTSFGKHEEGQGHSIKYQVDKMTYNSISGDVIAVDNQQKIIYQINLRDYTVRDLITEHIGNVTALSFGKLDLLKYM